jgi:hypothetical protein
LRKLMKFHISFMEVGYVRSITNSRVQSSWEALVAQLFKWFH